MEGLLGLVPPVHFEEHFAEVTVGSRGIGVKPDSCPVSGDGFNGRGTMVFTLDEDRIARLVIG